MKRLLTAYLCGLAVLSFAGCRRFQSPPPENKDNIVTFAARIDEIQIEKPPRPEKITDEDVDSELQSVLEFRGTRKELDGTVGEGDHVLIGFTVHEGDNELPGLSQTHMEVTAGEVSDELPDGLQDALLGHSVGDAFSWDDASTGLVRTYEITILDAWSFTTPEFNDEFVRKISDKCRTVRQYRKAVKKEMEDRLEADYEILLQGLAWEKARECAEVKDYPRDMLDEKIAEIKASYEEQAADQGMSYSDFVENAVCLSVEEFDQYCEDMAKATLKDSLILDAVAEEYSLGLTNKEYRKQLEERAKELQTDSTSYVKDNMDNEELRQSMQLEIVKDWIASHVDWI